MDSDTGQTHLGSFSRYKEIIDLNEDRTQLSQTLKGKQQGLVFEPSMLIRVTIKQPLILTVFMVDKMSYLK